MDRLETYLNHFFFLFPESPLKVLFPSHPPSFLFNSIEMERRKGIMKTLRKQYHSPLASTYRSRLQHQLHKRTSKEEILFFFAFFETYLSFILEKRTKIAIERMKGKEEGLDYYLTDLVYLRLSFLLQRPHALLLPLFELTALGYLVHEGSSSYLNGNLETWLFNRMLLTFTFSKMEVEWHLDSHICSSYLCPHSLPFQRGQSLCINAFGHLHLTQDYFPFTIEGEGIAERMIQMILSHL